VTETVDPALFYQIHLFVCTNRRPDGHKRGSCAALNSEVLRDYLKAKCRDAGITGIRVNSAGCLDRCELGPVMVIYPEGIWYSIRTEQDADEIIETHLKQGGRVPRLMLQPDDRFPKPE